jgi:hypothetical protein
MAGDTIAMSWPAISHIWRWYGGCYASFRQHTAWSNAAMIRHRIACLSLLSFAAGGCSADLGESSAGELDAVEFSYQSSCFFGCELDRPVLSGSTLRISVSDAGDEAGVSVRSSDEAIASFAISRHCACERSGDGWAEATTGSVELPCSEGWTKDCNNSIAMSTHAPGDAHLELYSADQALIDRVEVHVRDAARARFESGAGDDFEATNRLKLAPGETRAIRVSLEDTAGERLLAPDNVCWSVADPAIAAYSVGWDAWGERGSADLVAGDRASLRGVALGSTRLRISAQTLESELDVTVE